MSETKVVTHRCKTCNQKITISTPPELGRELMPCDMMMCGFCGRVSMFDADMKLIDVTLEDMEMLKKNNYPGWVAMRQDAFHVSERIKLN